MYLIGLTGGVGTGKNAVASIMEELGANVIDSNKLANKLMQIGKPAYKDIIEAFGSKVMDFQEGIDRVSLTKMTLKDKKKRDKLHEIMFPAAVDAEWSEIFAIKRDDPFATIVINSPFIIETGIYKELDTIVMVTSEREMVLDRLTKRDKLPKERIEAIINSQMPDEEKKTYANYIIENNGSLKELKPKVKELYKEIQNSRE